MTGCTGHYHEPGCPPFDQPAAPPSAAAERIAEIRARVTAATDGPWISTVNASNKRTADIMAEIEGNDPFVMTVREPGDEQAWCAWRGGSLEFVIHSREDVPWLLAELDRLTAERAAAQARADGYALLVAEYRAALSWYADEKVYDRLELYCEPAGGRTGSIYWTSLAEEDDGERARAILAADPEARASELLARGREGR